jgi:hypothetical protein
MIHNSTNINKMIHNSTNINKMNNHLSPQSFEHKINHDKYR